MFGLSREKADRNAARAFTDAAEFTMGSVVTLRYMTALRARDQVEVARMLRRTSRTLELNHLGGTGRWELRRTVVRQEGHPLRLVILADLRRALREEERQAWKRIIRVLSHEINNSLAPIKSIAGSFQSLIRRGPLPTELDEDMETGLKVISGRAESLGRFMASYAQLARLPEPRPSEVDVNALVRRIVAIETRVEVGVKPGPELIIKADADQLEQLLINLLRNAVDAALETDGRVELSWSARGDQFQMVVTDEGPGLPADTGNLFVPFYTTKPGGSGIGLALCLQIAEGHGGTLTLENATTGRGVRACLTLPVEVTRPARKGSLVVPPGSR